MSDDKGKTRLGRGLSALLGEDGGDYAALELAARNRRRYRSNICGRTGSSRDANSTMPSSNRSPN